MWYSLPVMSHVFPVVRRQNTAVSSKDHWHCTTVLAYVVKSGAHLLHEVGGRRKQQNITTTTTSHCCQKNVEMQYSLAVMFHAFPRRQTRQSVVRITGIAHTIETCGKEWSSPPAWGGRKEKTATHNHNYITMLPGKCGDAILTSCYVACIPSSEETKHGSQ